MTRLVFLFVFVFVHQWYLIEAQHKNCNFTITESNSTLPEHFVQDLLHKFANDKSCTIQEDGYKRLLKSLNIGTPKTKTKKRSVPESDQMGAQDNNVDNDVSYVDVSKNCFTGQQLIQIHSANATKKGITKDELVHMSPAFVQQVSAHTCKDGTKPPQRNDKLTQAEMFGWGTLIVFIICLGTLPGGFIAPFRQSKAYHYILSCMMGLAGGCLLGDGVLHLVPDALGLDVLQPTPPEMVGKIYVAPYTWKLLAICLAAWAFFNLELIFTFIGMRSEQKENETPEVLSMKVIPSQPSEKYMLENGQSNGGYVSSASNVPNGDSSTAVVEKAAMKDAEANNEVMQTERKSNISLAYMIIIGDAIHNCADGLAIGAAFNVGWKSGLSTSIAIFCHEVPHELGDFAALLSVGWSYKKALIMNFVSGLTAFLGLYIGIPVSNNLVARQWIFAVTAGFFLYIALSDLVPELLAFFKEYDPKITWICVNLGIFLGLLIMMIIVIFEDHIVVN